MTSAMKLRNELYTDTWYCLSPHGSSLKLTVTVLFPSQFLKAIFSIVLYIIITVKKFVKRLLFIFFLIFNSGYLRNITENSCHNGCYDYFRNHIKAVIEYRINYRQSRAGIFAEYALSYLIEALLREEPFGPCSVEYRTRYNMDNIS